MSKSKYFKNQNMFDEGPYSYLRHARPLPPTHIQANHSHVIA